MQESFFRVASRQLRTGTRIALGWGTIVGTLIGLAVVSLENAHFVLATPTSRILAVVFLGSAFPLLTAAAFLPLELSIATAASLSTRAAGLHARRIYHAAFLLGLLLVLCVFWLGFNGLRDPRSPQARLLFVSLAALCAVLVVTSGISRKRKAPEPGAPSRWLPWAVLVCSVATFGSYVSLRNVPGVAARPRTPLGAETGTVSSLRTPRHNVILVSIDTLRFDHLSTYGYPRQTSPNIDRIAADGVVFTGARSHAPWTLPSHATLLTSLYPVSHGARISSLHAPVVDRLEERHTTLAELAALAGMRTAAVVSTPWLGPKWGLLQGFEHFQVADPKALSSESIVDEAIRWIGDGDDRPFFLFLHFFDVHNYDSPPRFADLYVDPGYDGALRGTELLTAANIYADLTDPDLAYLIALYDGALRHVDEQVGRLVDRLGSGGQLDRTLLVVTADHGEEFRDHGGTGHGFTLYSEMLRVPLIFRFPEGGPRHRRLDEEVGLIDVLPTLLDYLGVPPPPAAEGMSLRPLIEGRPLPARPLFAEDTYFLNSYSVVQDGMKYVDRCVPPPELLNPRLLFVNIRSFFRCRGSELFSLSEDPGERTNLADQSRAASERFRSLLAEHVRVDSGGARSSIESATLEQLRSLGYVR